MGERADREPGGLQEAADLGGRVAGRGEGGEGVGLGAGALGGVEARGAPLVRARGEEEELQLKGGADGEPGLVGEGLRRVVEDGARGEPVEGVCAGLQEVAEDKGEEGVAPRLEEPGGGVGAGEGVGVAVADAEAVAGVGDLALGVHADAGGRGT